jgi:uncharacterized protein YqeY
LVEDVKAAIRAKDASRLQVLRSLVAGIKDERDRKAVDDLSNDQELQVLMRGVKSRRDAVQQAQELGRPDVAEREAAEIRYIEEYLPKQMSGDELMAKVRELAAEIGFSGPKDTGRLMQEWMIRYRGQAEGREVQAAVKALK